MIVCIGRCGYHARSADACMSCECCCDDTQASILFSKAGCPVGQDGARQGALGQGGTGQSRACVPAGQLVSAEESMRSRALPK